MAIDFESFVSTHFVPREAEIPMPVLQPWSDDGEVPVWKVRGLTGKEWWQCHEAVGNRKDIAEIVGGFIGGDSVEVSNALSNRFLPDSPTYIALGIELMMRGSVDPDPSNKREFFAKVAKCFLREFRVVTEEIIKLSEQGHLPGK